MAQRATLRPPTTDDPKITVDGLPISIRSGNTELRQILDDATPVQRRYYEAELYRAGLRSLQPDGHGYVMLVKDGGWYLVAPLNQQDPGYRSGLLWAEGDALYEDALNHIGDPADLGALEFVYRPQTSAHSGHEDPDGASRRRGWGPGWREPFTATLIVIEDGDHLPIYTTTLGGPDCTLTWADLSPEAQRWCTEHGFSVDRPHVYVEVVHGDADAWPHDLSGWPRRTITY